MTKTYRLGLGGIPSRTVYLWGQVFNLNINRQRCLTVLCGFTAGTPKLTYHLLVGMQPVRRSEYLGRRCL